MSETRFNLLEIDADPASDPPTAALVHAPAEVTSPVAEPRDGIAGEVFNDLLAQGNAAPAPATATIACRICGDTGVDIMRRCRCPIGASLSVAEVMAGGKGKALPPIEGRDHRPSAPATLEELAQPAQAQEAAQAASQAPQAARQSAAEVRGNLVALELPGEITGEVIFWTLSGDVSIAALAAAFQAQGLDEALLPAAPSPAAALHRAADEQKDAGAIVRKRPKGGWQITRVTADAEGELAFENGARISLNEQEQIAIDWPAGAAPDAQLEAEVRAAFERHQTQLSATDISAWLVKAQISSVALRSTGGVYFAPRQGIDQLRKIKRALAACTRHTIYEIPAIHSAEAMVAVIDSLARECDETIKKIRDEVQENDMGKRAIGTRINEAQALTEKVEAYEKLLGRPLGDITAKLKALRADLGKMTSRFLLLETD